MGGGGPGSFGPLMCPNGGVGMHHQPPPMQMPPQGVPPDAVAQHGAAAAIVAAAAAANAAPMMEVPRRQAVVDRLRKRIENYRKRQSECLPKHDRSFNGFCEQNLQDTMLLKQKFLETKAKRAAKKSEKKTEPASAAGGPGIPPSMAHLHNSVSTCCHQLSRGSCPATHARMFLFGLCERAAGGRPTHSLHSAGRTFTGGCWAACSFLLLHVAHSTLDFHVFCIFLPIK
jgi:hypothetical protein